MKLIIFLFFLMPQTIFAATEIINVFGVSVNNVNDATTPAIFGGIGGSDCSADAVDINSTCNSCQEDTLAICNTNRVYPELEIRIEFKDNESEGKTLIYETTKNVAVTLETTGDSTKDKVIAKGNTHIALIKWSTLCNILNEADTSCEKSFTGSLRIGTTDNNTDFKGTTKDISIKLINPTEAGDTVDICANATRGICQFSVYPGDEKVYLEDLQSKGSFPNDSNTQFKFFRIIYSKNTFDKSELNPREAIAAGNVSNIQILEGDSNTLPDLADDTIDDLNNDQLYFFRGMLVDEANNIMDITADTVYENDAYCGGDKSKPENDFLCPLTATPDQVIGLLAEDLNCFISTVAYGSSFAGKVNDFRKFRRKFLLPYKWGRMFNKAYYKYGAILSQKIAKSEMAKSLARLLLFPTWLFAKASLMWGPMKVIFSVSLVLLILVAVLLKLSFFMRKSFIKIFFLTFFITSLSAPKVQAEKQDLVEPKMRNSLPSSRYDNPTNREIRVPHPNAKKGLTRITSDKVYLYETYESPKTGNMSFRFGLYDPQELEGSENDKGERTKFVDIYESAEAPMLLIDFEWKWVGFLGELNLQLGTGLFLTQGNGVFQDNPTRQAKEKFTFIAIPFTGSVLYKLRFSEHQWFIPYGGGGLGVMGFSEIRDDNAGPKFGGALIAPIFGGLALSINDLAPTMGKTLDREYGINTALFAMEYRQILGLSTFDFTGEIINAGLMLEY